MTASNDLLVYLSNIPPNVSLANWSLRMPFIAGDIRAIARELLKRRATDVLTIPLADIDDFEEVTREIDPALLAHLKAASVLQEAA